MSDTCKNIRDQLVDYVDGDLPPVVAAGVAAHLESCAACRRELAALTHSLKLAQAVWQEASVAETPADAARRTGVPSWRPQRRHLARTTAIAASLLIVVGTGSWWWLARRSGSELVSAGPPTLVEGETKLECGQDPGGAAQPAPLSDEEIERLLVREEAAARLAVSAQVLADQPGAEEYAQRSFRYLAETFPNTVAGREAARRFVTP